jgi:hypothetical protein
MFMSIAKNLDRVRGKMKRRGFKTVARQKRFGKTTREVREL